MKESTLQRDVRLLLGSKPDLVIWRNNTGRVFNEESQNWIQYGLCVGSSDLIGLLAPRGRFFALEIKGSRGKREPEQKLFVALVNAKGGYAAFVSSVEEAEAAYQEARR